MLAPPPEILRSNGYLSYRPRPKRYQLLIAPSTSINTGICLKKQSIEIKWGGQKLGVGGGLLDTPGSILTLFRQFSGVFGVPGVRFE